MTTTTEELSDLAKAIKARPRKAYPFPVNGYLGLGGEVVHSVAVRVPTKREQDLAVDGARDYASKLEKAATDPDVVIDAKAAHIVATAVREAKDPNKLPAFPNGAWVADNLTAEQIGTLVNLVNEVRRKENPGAWTIDDGAVEALADLCARVADSDIPEAVLADKPREYLSQLVVLLSVKLVKERAEHAAAMAAEAVEPEPFAVPTPEGARGEPTGEAL